MTENDGLLHALLLDGHGGARQVAWGEVRRWTRADGVLWLHLDQTSPAARDWLGEHGGLPELAFTALMAEETRPRVAVEGASLVVILRGVNLNPGADPEDMVSLRLWSDGTRIVTTRMRKLAAVQDLVAALLRGEGPADAAAFLPWLAGALVRRMAEVIAGLRERVDRLEEQVLEEESRLLRPQLTAVQREAVLLRRYLAPQQVALASLQTDCPQWLDREARAHLREANDGLTRYVEDLDAARDRAALIQEDLFNRVSERMESRMYALTLIATVFLPLTFITGLLGINVAGIPGSEDNRAFLIVVLVLIALAGLLLLWMRRRDWF